MGNQRQVLKERIEKDLQLKIQETKDVLNQINRNLEINKQNSLNAKEEIRVTADLMKEILIQRKKDMIKEVESFHHAQAKPLQDAMKSVYITLGSLQSTLTNLDTFDQGQLVHLQIPQIDRTHAIDEPAPIIASLECEKLKEDLKDWGNISVDGFQSCIAMELEEIGKKTTVAGNIAGSSKCSTSGFQVLSMNANNGNSITTEKMTEARKENEFWWNTGGIEKWLSGTSSKRTSVDENDISDFLMVSSPSQFPCEEDKDVEPVTEALRKNQMKRFSRDDGESSSSIVCLEKDPESQEDLSLWLKPKKAKSVITCLDRQTPDLAAVFPENLEKRQYNPTLNNRILEFPCLQMDSNSWVRKKKPRTALSNCSQNSSLSSQDLIPPTYTLPNPFWLKKYR